MSWWKRIGNPLSRLARKLRDAEIARLEKRIVKLRRLADKGEPMPGAMSGPLPDGLLGGIIGGKTGKGTWGLLGEHDDRTRFARMASTTEPDYSPWDGNAIGPEEDGA